ncbi:unnamed protein product [Blepharisma stoltei]|uniref:START domain-containing protein n=1 Tax=Blepharisma stoltei TaxID=1481888 RepID=A0AAU9JMG4_9CILI|nr:unnamed protein product [Blepharisma stoltei]
MGCCEARDSPPAETIKPNSKDNAPITRTPKQFQGKHESSLGFNLTETEEIIDDRVEEIVEYWASLKKDPKWLSIIQTEHIMVKRLEGSKYCENLPVFYSKIYFDKYVTPNIIIKQLNDAKERKKWDKSITDIENIRENLDEVIVYTYISTFGYKGDFLEKKTILKKDDHVVIVTYSIADDSKPPLDGVSRGETLMTVQIIKYKNDRTVMTMITHQNYKDVFASLFSYLIPMKLKEWGTAFRKRVHSLV